MVIRHLGSLRLVGVRCACMYLVCIRLSYLLVNIYKYLLTYFFICIY